MKSIKMFGLAAVAAMAFIGVSSAMATGSTELATTLVIDVSETHVNGMQWHRQRH
jgi:hypothetical protein